IRTAACSWDMWLLVIIKEFGSHWPCQNVVILSLFSKKKWAGWVNLQRGYLLDLRSLVIRLVD
ncbi:hypothetical protein ACJX0J_023229, partial [Zea mays]